MAKNKPKPKDQSLSSLIDSLTKQQDVRPSKESRKAARMEKKRRRKEPRRTAACTEAHNQPTKKRRRRSSQHLLEQLETLIRQYRVNQGPFRPPVSQLAFRKRQWKAGDLLQPRPRDYGGLGLARPTLFLSLADPSFIPKLEQEFSEHVPGFFGKQRTKAMKKQMDGNMLWRRMQRKEGGQMLDRLSPDERVEAMLQAGML